MTNEIFAANVRHLRRRRGMTQVELAEALRVKQSHISAYERGVCKPLADNLIALAYVLDVSLDDLVNRAIDPAEHA